MNILLEYSDTQYCFHNNYKETTGQFHNELFVNGYRPITIIDEKRLDEDEYLEAIMDYICDNKHSFEEAARQILFYLLQ